MAGTRSGGQRAAEQNKKRYGPDFYRKIGHIGGQRGHTGGFHANPELARIAGAKGGKISRKPSQKNVAKVLTKVRSSDNEPINLPNPQTRRGRVWDVFKVTRWRKRKTENNQ